MKRKQEKKLKLLLICAHYWPDYGPSTPLFTTIAEDLQKMGYDVSVITTSSKYNEKNNNVNRKFKIFYYEYINGIKVSRCYIYRAPKNSIIKRIFSHIILNILSAIMAIRYGKFDIIFAGAPSLWCGLPLLLKGIFKKIPYVYIIYDIYPDIIQKLGIVNNKAILKMISIVEGYLYDKSKKISVLSEGFKKNLIKKGVPENKINIVPVHVDTQFIRPLPKDKELCDLLQINKKFVVLYAGNIGFSQGLETLLEAASILKDREEIVFVIIGEGATKSSLENRAKEMQLENCRFLDFQDPENIPKVYSIGDVGLVIMKKNIVVESVPSKTYSIMAAGLPVIATIDRNSEIGKLINDSDCGVCLEAENSIQLAEYIVRLSENPEEVNRLGTNGRQIIIDKYSRTVAAKQYDEIICDIINSFALSKNK